MQVLVVGGGILGVSAALGLAGRGHEVRLEEQATLGSGSTGKAAGILSTFTWNEHDLRLIQQTRGAVGELISLALAAGHKEARGAWRKAESLVVAGAGQLRTLDRMQALCERHGEEVERFEARQLGRDFADLLFAPGEEALVAQEDGVVEAGDLFVALRARLADEGVQVREHVARDAGRLAAPHAGADAVVVAGGAWTRGLLAQAGVALPALAYRTQLASLGLAGGGALPIVHDLVHRFYMRPESEGSFLAGDGTQLRAFEPDAYDESGDPEFTQSVAERVVARVREGGEARLRRSWAGLLVGTPDRHPLCGPVPRRPGLFVLTGDNGFGLMRGLALGERLADAVAGNVDPVLDPARFGWPPPATFELREGYGDVAQG